VAIYHQNIQGLQCKTVELLNFLDPNLRHVLSISEHHLDQLELGASYCQSSLKKGVVCIYVYRDLNFNTVDLNAFSNDEHIEVCAVLLSNYFCNIYVLFIGLLLEILLIF
jgi:hypothetical protein